MEEKILYQERRKERKDYKREKDKRYERDISPRHSQRSSYSSRGRSNYTETKEDYYSVDHHETKNYGEHRDDTYNYPPYSIPNDFNVPPGYYFDQQGPNFPVDPHKNYPTAFHPESFEDSNHPGFRDHPQITANSNIDPQQLANLIWMLQSNSAQNQDYGNQGFLAPTHSTYYVPDRAPYVEASNSYYPIERNTRFDPTRNQDINIPQFYRQ